MFIPVVKPSKKNTKRVFGYKDMTNHCSYAQNFAKLKPEKNSGPIGIQTHDLCDTGVVL